VNNKRKNNVIVITLRTAASPYVKHCLMHVSKQGCEANHIVSIDRLLTALFNALASLLNIYRMPFGTLNLGDSYFKHTILKISLGLIAINFTGQSCCTGIFALRDL